jgi:hypothetical protein
MTPGEQATLDLILRDVEECNGRCANGPPTTRRIVTLENHRFAAGRGDYLIDKIEFTSTGAQCA